MISKNFWKNKRVFITGHTGFKGSWLVALLSELDSELYGYSLKPENKSMFRQLNLKKLLKKNYYGDITDYSNLKKKIKISKPEIVIHLAAQSLVKKSFKLPIPTYRANLMGTLNLLNICKDENVKSILIVTSDKVYKNDNENKNNKKFFTENDELGGNDIYSSSKACVEIMTKAFEKNFYKNTKSPFLATVRSGNVIGGGDWSEDRLIPDIMNSFINKKTLYVRNKFSVRPWQYVLDVLFGYLLIAESLYKKKTISKGSWNIAPDKGNIKVIDIINFFKKKMKLKVVFKKSNFHEANVLNLSSKKIKKIFKWKNFSNIDISLNQTCDWYFTFINDKKNLKKITKLQINNYLKKI